MITLERADWDDGQSALRTWTVFREDSSEEVLLEQRSEDNPETTRNKVWVEVSRHCGKVCSQDHAIQSGVFSQCFLPDKGGQTSWCLTWHSGPFLAWSPQGPLIPTLSYRVQHKSLIGPGQKVLLPMGSHISVFLPTPPWITLAYC